MKTTFSVILTLIIFSSCLKKNEIDDKPTIDPPFEKYKYFWTEIEKKEGTGNWVQISNGNVLRLYTNDLDTADRMTGQYEYNSINAKINIPENYYFTKDKDSLHFYRPVNPNNSSDPGKYTMDIFASVEYELVNDSLMVIRNKSTNPGIEIKYSK